MQKVSIIMSVYNGEKHLRESVDSILNQTFKDFEFIIINDGSKDQSKDILESYKDERIKLIHHKNMGLTKSLNIGIANAKGKYIARQDADDISEPERLKTQFDFMEANPGLGLIGSQFKIIKENGEIAGSISLPLEDKIIKEMLIEMNQFCHVSVMIRREVLDKVGLYREYFKYAQDYDLWLRISEQYEVRNLPELLIRYRVAEKSITSNKMYLQSRYAGLAIMQAMLRRETGFDEIQQGKTPDLPRFKQLPKTIKTNIAKYYKNRRAELLKEKDIGTYLRDSILYYRLKLHEYND